MLKDEKDHINKNKRIKSQTWTVMVQYSMRVCRRVISKILYFRQSYHHTLWHMTKHPLSSVDTRRGQTRSMRTRCDEQWDSTGERQEYPEVTERRQPHGTKGTKGEKTKKQIQEFHRKTLSHSLFEELQKPQNFTEISWEFALN